MNIETENNYLCLADAGAFVGQVSVHKPERDDLPKDIKVTLAAHRGSDTWTSAWQLGITLLLFAGMWVLMWYSLSWSYALTLFLSIPTAGLAVRLFILQHDCGHGSLFASMRANRIVGSVLSAITLTPFECWRRQHAVHHATNGQLDHRGIGDVDTITLAEYAARSTWGRLSYRLVRNPLVLIGIGPIVYFLIIQRFTGRLPVHWKRERRNVHATNLMLLCIVGLLGWCVGWSALLKIHLPVTALAASIGAWLFYIQHQFDPTYWARDDNWVHHQAAIQGSSYLHLPSPLTWITASIGYHHIHHLDSRIPNYALSRCHDAHSYFQTAHRLTFWSSLRCIHLKLWDEQTSEMIGFRQARQRLAKSGNRKHQRPLANPA